MLTSKHGTKYSTIFTTKVQKHTHTQPFNGPFSRTTWVSRYQKGKTNLDFSEARDGEWQWHQLGHMQVCTLLQTDNRASTPPLSFLQPGCPSCRPTNSVKALKARYRNSPDNNVDENSSVFSLIRTCWFPSARPNMWAVKLCANKIFQFLTGGAD